MEDKSNNEFNDNDLYLINENYQKGNDDFLQLFVGDKAFVVPYGCTVGNNTDKQAVSRFENQLFDFEDVECGKYNRNKKKIRSVDYEGRKYIVPYDHQGEIVPEEIAKMAIEKAETKYNTIINAHRELKERGENVGVIRFYERDANEYVSRLSELEAPVLLSEDTPDMLKIAKFTERVGKNTKVFKGEVKKIVDGVVKEETENVKQVIEKVSALGEEGGEQIVKVAKKLAKNVKKKIVETEFKSAKKYVPDSYKVAMLAVALGGVGGGVYLNNKLNKDGEEKVIKVDERKNKIVQDGVYTTFDGRKLQDKHGNLEAINRLRKEITLMMIAVEGYANNIFPDTRNNATGGIGLTVSFDENGNERKLNLGEADWSDKKVIEQKWMYMEKHMLPIIASIDKKCLDEEILATIGAGFCWGPTNLRNSEYLKSVKQGDSVDVLTRKLTGFRNPSGLVKREYLLACLLEKKWDVNDLKDMPVYYLKDKGFLHAAIYTLDFDDICPIKKDKKGNPILDKGHNQIPRPDADGFCTLYMDRSKEVLDKILNPNAKFGDYKTVDELLPKEALEYLKPDYCLSSLQEKLTKLNKEKKSTIEYGEALAMMTTKGR
ncbi:MAG: hypothetical protein IKW58_02035 [Alphaproteobacteria bacterium]|nr:hypothetical protein [Alphaproteobacteria bacterium]